MPEIRPFRAWRYDTRRAGSLSTLIAPPYDVISPQEQQALYARSPYNVIRLELTAPEEGDPPGVEGEQARHRRARETLQFWMREGILRKDGDPTFYLYRQTFTYQGRQLSRRCVLAAVRLYPWSSNVILPHERTLAAPKAERLRLMRALGANVSPIWALYEDDGRVAAVMDHEPVPSGDPPIVHERLDETTVDDDGVEHQLIAIDDRQQIEALRRVLLDQPLYIADGHHRYETALAYRDEGASIEHPGERGPRDYVLMALTATDDPGLIVLPTHRLIAHLPAERLAALDAMLLRYFSVEDVPFPASPDALPDLLAQRLSGERSGEHGHAFMLHGPEPRQLRLLRVLPGLDLDAPDQSLAELDVWLAHALLFERSLELSAESMVLQENVRYTRDVLEAVSSVQSGQSQLALFLAPTPVEQLLDVARAQQVMPQKSTYFYPKPPTGLVIRLLDGS